MAIEEAIKQLQLNKPSAYSELRNSIDMAIAALEKQIPYKPKVYEDKYYSCKCGNPVMMKWKNYPSVLMPKSEGLPFCLGCGQAIDWSGENVN